MDYLNSLLENSSLPFISAFILGLLTAVSPCPLATNMTAIGFISQDIHQKHQVFINGLLYTLGRLVSYTCLGIILILFLREGTSFYPVQKFISKYGNLLLGPFLLMMGIYLLGILKISFPRLDFIGNKMESHKRGKLGSFILGVVFALAFCPSSGIFYFGMLIPLSASETGGFILPAVFAIATGIPVILVAWLLAYSINGLSKYYQRIQSFEKWFRRFIALLFIAVGIYYSILYF